MQHSQWPSKKLARGNVAVEKRLLLFSHKLAACLRSKRRIFKQKKAVPDIYSFAERRATNAAICRGIGQSCSVATLSLPLFLICIIFSCLQEPTKDPRRSASTKRVNLKWNNWLKSGGGCFIESRAVRSGAQHKALMMIIMAQMSLLACHCQTRREGIQEPQ